jgi:hypothetical protein
MLLRHGIGLISSCTTMGGGQGQCQVPSGQTIDATFQKG